MSSPVTSIDCLGNSTVNRPAYVRNATILGEKAIIRQEYNDFVNALIRNALTN